MAGRGGRGREMWMGGPEWKVFRAPRLRGMSGPSDEIRLDRVTVLNPCLDRREVRLALPQGWSFVETENWSVDLMANWRHVIPDQGESHIRSVPSSRLHVVTRLITVFLFQTAGFIPMMHGRTPHRCLWRSGRQQALREVGSG